MTQEPASPTFRILRPRVRWDDLVLPADQIAVMEALAGQVRHRTTVHEHWGFAAGMSRGLGITALFSGGPGTGKAMAAEVIAQDLQVDLYLVDLAAVVSKYLGETEKNLRQVFAAAEVSGAVLFFDEADALFGRRSEVRDSHDRYANLEVACLLQQMEAYRGLAILATTCKQALDTAFVRRLRFVIDFPRPDQRDRRSIWQKVFPAQAPVDELDWERLATFDLAGGDIQRITLNAAFLAAQAGSKITLPLVLTALHAEYRKLGRKVHES